MLLDLITAFPIDVAVAVYESGQQSAVQGDVGMDRLQGADVTDPGVATLRIVRMFRLLKLARILRATRILKRWENQIGISFAMIALFKFTLLIVMTTQCV